MNQVVRISEVQIHSEYSTVVDTRLPITTNVKYKLVKVSTKFSTRLHTITSDILHNLIRKFAIFIIQDYIRNFNFMIIIKLLLSFNTRNDL